MTGLNALIGYPVVSRTSAEDLGSITAAVIDVPTLHVVAWQIGKGRKASFVDHASLAGIGGSAAIVDDEASLREPRTTDEIATSKGERPLLNVRVLGDNGDVIGVVTDVEIDTDTGALGTITSSGGDLAPDRIRGLGSYALVVSAPTPSPTSA